MALAIENRPDNCEEDNIKELLEYGCTRVEIGVQILDDEIYKKTNRGHTIKTVIDATRRLKDAGFKIGYHIMPGLPYSNPSKDLEKFNLLFSDENFKPDQLKLYPCQIVDGSPLAKMYKKINYTPYDNKTIKTLIEKMMEIIPRYCRIMRVMREIPKEKMKEAVASTSMRHDINKDKNTKLKEIRSREVGMQKGEINQNLKLKTTEYKASQGKEFFLEIINKENILFGLLRLRFTSKNEAIVRELHVYGQALNLKEAANDSQHKGLGKQLIKKAEELALANKIKTLKIISGVGVREYYKKLGYVLNEPYMEKEL